MSSCSSPESVNNEMVCHCQPRTCAYALYVGARFRGSDSHVLQQSLRHHAGYRARGLNRCSIIGYAVTNG
jgi:hypothetical protein